MNSRKVRLMRKETVRHGLPSVLANEKVCNLGSYGDRNGNTFRPFTYDEEDIYMSEIVNVKVTDPGFRQAVTRYYQNLTLKVGPEGIELEIGTDAKGYPISVEDTLKYNFAKNHPWFAKNKLEAEAIGHYQFWIEDPEAENESKGKTLNVVKQAYVELAKIAEDEVKLDWVMRNLIIKYPDLGSIVELSKLSPNKKELKIGSIVDKDPAYFVEVVSDPNLSIKAEIVSMVEAGVLVKEGQKYINGTEVLGTLDSTIAWIKDPTNSESYAILQARLSEFGSPVKTFEKKVKNK
jgi:hypothetical protein